MSRSSGVMCVAKCVAAAEEAEETSAVSVSVSAVDEGKIDDDEEAGGGATPHMNVNVPLSAPAVPPDTGASKKYGACAPVPVPVPATAAAMARDVAGSIVLQSMYVFRVALVGVGGGGEFRGGGGGGVESNRDGDVESDEAD